MCRTKTILLYVCIVLAAIGCSPSETFSISGNITNSKGEMLYLEHIGASRTETIDSVRLDKSGRFRFSHPRNAYPELYRLRTKGQSIVIAIDSTEQVSISGSADNLLYDAYIEGSEKTRQITDLRRSLVQNSADEHKATAAKLIPTDPRSIVAYYALLQHKDGQFVFNLSDKADRVYFSAVATAWKAFMPDAERSRKLYSLVDEEIRNEKKSRQQQIMQTFIEESDNAFLDISLADERGNMQSLSALRGKVILLDFSAIEMQKSSAYIFELRELYNKYHTEGFEIYQVFADHNRLQWEESAINLPWVSVWGGDTNAACYRTYNVQSIPTSFLLNKKGEVVGRNIPFDQLPQRIEECLRLRP